MSFKVGMSRKTLSGEIGQETGLGAVIEIKAKVKVIEKPDVVPEAAIRWTITHKTASQKIARLIVSCFQNLFVLQMVNIFNFKVEETVF